MPKKIDHEKLLGGPKKRKPLRNYHYIALKT